MKVCCRAATVTQTWIIQLYCTRTCSTSTTIYLLYRIFAVSTLCSQGYEGYYLLWRLCATVTRVGLQRPLLLLPSVVTNSRIKEEMTLLLHAAHTLFQTYFQRRENGFRGKSCTQHFNQSYKNELKSENGKDINYILSSKIFNLPVCTVSQVLIVKYSVLTVSMIFWLYPNVTLKLKSNSGNWVLTIILH